MKIISIILMHKNGKEKEEKDLWTMAEAFHLQSFGFFQKGSVKDFATFFSRTLAFNTNLGVRQSVEHQDYLCHVHSRLDGISGVVIADHEYPQRVAFSLLSKLGEEFKKKYSDIYNKVPHPMPQDMPFPDIESSIVKFQDPAKGDELTAIQRQLDDTKIVLHKTIDSVLQRGQKLDDLVDKSDDLSRQSKMFYKTAKKQNGCCVVM
eukprot:GCRY01003290.1.p1 GENE.GCRY01003290.1~~GCRY01003290.1.p1  ORF type:complete len:206 (+),score=32.19 GCRY01003290.1:133-750(+)